MRGRHCPNRRPATAPGERVPPTRSADGIAVTQSRWLAAVQEPPAHDEPRQSAAQDTACGAQGDWKVGVLVKGKSESDSMGEAGEGYYQKRYPPLGSRL
eukprot:scaffold13448_cov109-Isochrysis_galbana.AAC.4